MEDASHEKLYGDLQRISTLRKKIEKQSENLSNYYYNYYWKGKVFLSIIGTF